MKIYNSLTKQKEEVEGGVVRMYCCGITPYKPVHIGNYRTYIFEDVLRRALEYSGKDVKHIQNITDIGETDSAGHDKVSDDAQNIVCRFIRDLGRLNILLPHKFCWASDYIVEQQDLILSLIHI